MVEDTTGIPQADSKDAARFVRHVLGGVGARSGAGFGAGAKLYVGIVSADASGEGGEWDPESIEDKFYEWPGGIKGALRHAFHKAHHKGLDVYVATALYPRPKRDKTSVSEVISISADQDRAPVPNGALSPTCSVLTSEGSRQLVWRFDQSVSTERASKISTALKEAIGANAAGIGRVIRLPDSVNRKPGREGFVVRLEYLDASRTVSADDLEEALREAGHPVDATSSPKGGSEATAAERLLKGERNEGLASAAGRMRRHGFSEEAIEAALLEENRRRCEPPLEENEVRKIARSIGRYDPHHDYADTSVSGYSANTANNAQRVQDESAAPGPPWGDPAEFHSVALPPFPRGTFPEWLENYVEQVAKSTQTPVDLAAMLALTVGAAACARLVEVEAWDGWIEPTNIYTCSTMRPGTRKTEVFRRMSAPVAEHQKYLLEQKAPDVAKALSRRRVLEARLKKAELKAAQAPAGTADADKLEKAALEAAEELASVKVEAPPQLLADDASPERLAAILAEQQGCVAVLSSEGGIFDMMAGRYSQGIPNLDVYLKGHAGDRLRVDRIGRPPDEVERPAITTGLAIQPSVVRGLAERPGFRGRGLLGRFAYSNPRDTLGSRKSRQPAVEKEVAERYRRKVRYILGLDLKSRETSSRELHTLRLSAAAQDVLQIFVDELEPQLAEHGALGDMTDWAGKLAGAVVRIAGILHMFDHAGEMRPWEHEIDEAVVGRAITVGRYLLPHAQYTLAYMGTDPVVGDARYILGHIERSGWESFTKRDLFEQTKGRFDKVTSLEPGLQLLIEHSYIREAPNQPADKRRGPGRKPSPVYQVNPKRLSRYSHNSQKGNDDISYSEG